MSGAWYRLGSLCSVGGWAVTPRGVRWVSGREVVLVVEVSTGVLLPSVSGCCLVMTLGRGVGCRDFCTWALEEGSGAECDKAELCSSSVCVGSVEELKILSGKKFLLDLHLPELLVFPPQTDFHDNRLYMSGHIILQDKVGSWGTGGCGTGVKTTGRSGGSAFSYMLRLGLELLCCSV